MRGRRRPSCEPELRAALDRLAAAELVFARASRPRRATRFKHALVRDAAHESLLKAERQRLHARIVRVLEERFPRRPMPSPSCSPGTAPRRGSPNRRSTTGSGPGSGRSRAPRWPRRSRT